MKPSGIGGMAVMEGVMMKNKEEYAVAVRKPDNEIVVEKSTYKDISDKVKLFKLPIFRGMLAFVDSMVIGVKVLNFSSSFFEEEEETEKSKKKTSKKDSKADIKKDADIEFEDLSAIDNVNEGQKKKNASEKADTEKTAAAAEKSEKSNALLMVFAVLLSIVLSVALFMVLPVLITNLFSRFVTNKYLMAFIEGMLRLVIFIGYVILAAKMPEIKRVFMYHGAEHKTINCLENGFELTVENVRWQSKQHKRCGTSFMLLVILISLIFFIALPVNGLFWRVISRIILVPFIAGVSYEFIRLAGRSESKIVDYLSKPGLWMQGLTTKEPDDSMIEVAIESVGAVFDWRAFLETSAAEEKSPKASGTKNTAVKNTAGKNIVDKNTAGKNAANKNTADKNTAGKNTVDKNIAVKNTVDKNTAGKNPVDMNTGNKAQTEERQVSKKEVSGKQPETAKPPVNTAMQSAPANKGHINSGRSRSNNAPSIAFKPSVTNRPEDEDDDILKALDKFFDEGHKDGKAGEK